MAAARREADRRGVLVMTLGMLASATLAAQVPPTADAPDLPPPGRMVEVGGFRLHLLCAGTPQPGRASVVLSAGAGDFAVDWGLVQPLVADSVRVCAYDRAGAGWSDPGPEPRTLHQEAAELDLLLERAGEGPPYVLVGHSLGGVVVRVFRERRPGDVVGMVLVDPTHEDARLGYRGQLVRLRVLASGRAVPPVQTLAESPPTHATGAGLDACHAAAAAAHIEAPFSKLPATDQPYRLWALRHPKCMASQDDYLPDELAQIRARRGHDPSLGVLPLIVLAAVPAEAPPGVSLADWRREKADHMADLARLSSRGRVLVDSLSGHHMQLDNPALVINAIRTVVREATVPYQR